MQGYFSGKEKAGWDTHGLPVEIEVEKQLGFSSKQEIEDYGIEKFNHKCKESVWKYESQWKKMTGANRLLDRYGTSLEQFQR